MTLRNLLDVQEVMFRAYVRNVMFFATLPYHLAHEVRDRPRTRAVDE
jgi:hypothetical protein